MAKLIMTLDNTVVREVPLDKQRITIGRKAHNDIRIENLAVSGDHALIVTILNDSFLEDLDSTNGTLVNGVPIKKHILQANDVIEIGKYKLKYLSDVPVGKTSVADFEKTMILRTPVDKLTAPPPPPQSMGDTQAMAATSTSLSPLSPPIAPTAPKQTGKPAVIQILTGANAGKELELTKNLTTLGKPGVQVAVITRRPHGYFIAHVEGEHYPLINGRPLDAQSHELHDHDVIELAGIKMGFFYKND